jgi:hypothetical protein
VVARAGGSGCWRQGGTRLELGGGRPGGIEERKGDHGRQISTRCRRREGGIARVGERLALFLEVPADEFRRNSRRRDMNRVRAFCTRGGRLGISFCFEPPIQSTAQLAQTNLKFA